MQNLTNESGPIIWDHIKTLVNQMTPEQLQMKAVFSVADAQDGEISSISILPEDHYTDGEFTQPASSLLREPESEIGRWGVDQLYDLAYKKGQPIIDINLSPKHQPTYESATN